MTKQENDTLCAYSNLRKTEKLLFDHKVVENMSSNLDGYINDVKKKLISKFKALQKYLKQNPEHAESIFSYPESAKGHYDNYDMVREEFNQWLITGTISHYLNRFPELRNRNHATI